MNFVLGLDYELYFGEAVGTIERCMLEPTDALAKQTEHLGLKLTLFVDSGYLLALKRAGCDQQFGKIAQQLKRLFAKGHDVQLHIHPHWEDSVVSAGSCDLIVERYRLHDFEPADRFEIVKGYKAVLENIIESPVTAYRAGGWCLQPFDQIHDALTQNGVHIDSTVFAGGHSADSGREFDFVSAPEVDYWRFERDPVQEEPAGKFTEIAISPVAITPMFYVKSQVQRKLQAQRNKNFGDGKYLEHGMNYYSERLLHSSVSPASVDGAKGSLLPRALAGVRDRGGSLLNVMGHPKALAPRSIDDLVRFLGDHSFDCHTIRTLARELPE